MTSTSSRAPLTGIRVLDLSRMYPGAFCSVLLADLGAEIIKIEAPGFGDGMRAMAAPGTLNAAHAALNRGKRSVVLDLRKPAGAEALRRLVVDADVLIESHKPGQLDAMGIGFEALRAIQPGLIWCALTGFGTSGPNVEAGGHDITYLGYSGMLSRLSQGDPTPPAVAVSLPMTGLMGVTGILAALQGRQQTGVGARVDANMVETAMWTLTEEFTRAAVAPTTGWGSMAARATYRCADGRFVVVAANEPKVWATLCNGLGVEDLAGHRMGVDPEAPVIARLTEVFASLSDGGVGEASRPRRWRQPGERTSRPANRRPDHRTTGNGAVARIRNARARQPAAPRRGYRNRSHAGHDATA